MDRLDQWILYEIAHAQDSTPQIEIDLFGKLICFIQSQTQNQVKNKSYYVQK